MTQAGDHSQDDIALVGEYALHLLDAEARLAFEKRLLGDAGLQALLRDWDESLITLAAEIEPVAPPPRLKSALEARLFGQARPGFWQGSFFGMRRAVSGLAMAAALVLLLGPQVWNNLATPDYRAEIAADDRSLVVRASFDADAAAIVINRVAGAAIPGRVLELWLIAPGANAPVSLGVLPDNQIATIALPENLRQVMIGATLAISDEPVGGSPSGAPTGKVLAMGPVTSS